MTREEVVDREAFASEPLLSIAPGFDWIFASRFNDGAIEDKIPQLRGRVIYYPRIVYQAFHPDIVYAFADGKFIKSPMGDYNSSIVLYGWRAGLSVDQIVQLFRPEVFESLGFLGPEYDGTTHMSWAEGVNTIGTRSLIDKWTAMGCFMHTFNHPKLPVLADLARALAAKAGVATPVKTPENYVQDDLLDSAVWPIYPDIATVRGGHGSYDFKTLAFAGDMPVILGLTDFVAQSLEAYRNLSRHHITCERLDSEAYRNLDRFVTPAKPTKPAAFVRRKSPYHGLPDHQFWKPSLVETGMTDVDPVVIGAFKVDEGTKVATAGSCFAQHLSRALVRSGFNYYVAETGPVERSFGVYSARYGNIYTARQLDQLFDRAYGNFTPRDKSWQHINGSLVDPFRPGVEPGGFATEAELSSDRDRHFTEVRRLFETLDVFVFTLGLTEAWQSKIDGAVFPSAPGVEGGEMDDSRYEFVNFTAAEVEDDLRRFIAKLRQVNPAAKVLFTVSPVPLKATFERKHVLSATTYSKAALRVAAENLSRELADVHYFPSFEIITGSYNRGAYWEDDLRSVRQEGVDHVMGLFLKHYADTRAAPAQRSEAEAIQEIMCDEDKIEQLEPKRD